MFEVHQGDCVELMAAMLAGSVDAVVCDPPYGIRFMGKAWDGVDIEAAIAKRRRNWEDTTASTREYVPEQPTQPIGSAAEAAGTYDRSLSANQAYQRWCEEWARECLRVLKPGGHLLASCGTRTYHRMTSGIEDAGFEIRDTICWLYGSGFPKSLDVGKAIDKRRDWSLVERLTTEIGRARTEAGLSLTEMGEAMQAATDGQYGSLYHRGGFKFFETGSQLPSRPEWDCLRDVLPIAEGFREVYEAAEREVVGEGFRADTGRMAQGEGGYAFGEEFDVTVPATPEAERWEGWGTALAPAHEPVVVARKPLSGTVASTVLEWGTGAINVDGCRVSSGQSTSRMGVCPSNGSAPHAEQLSGWHPVASLEAKEPIALALAVTRPEGDPVLLIRIGEEGDSHGRMAMSPSDTKAITSSNIASSWSASSAGGSSHSNTSITETATGLTTDPRILSFCRSAPTLLTTTRAVTPLGGCECDAWPVVENSSDGGWRWNAIPLRIARATVTAQGRWPKNVVLSHMEECEPIQTRANLFSEEPKWSCHPDCPVRLLDEQTGELTSGDLRPYANQSSEFNMLHSEQRMVDRPGDTGGASRFFYCAKSSRGERNAGLEGFEEQDRYKPGGVGGTGGKRSVEAAVNAPPAANVHPTVKPISLMRWLVRLVTPPGGTVLDPFTGSGSTGCAAVLEGFDFVGLEREAEYVAIAEARIAWWHKHRGDGEAAELLAAGELRDSVEATGQSSLFD